MNKIKTDQMWGLFSSSFLSQTVNESMTKPKRHPAEVSAWVPCFQFHFLQNIQKQYKIYSIWSKQAVFFKMSTFQESIIAFYDNRAARYDTEDPGFHNRLASDFVAWSEERLKTPRPTQMSHLDLCCGTGLVSFASLAKFGPETTIHGLDLSPQSLEIARSKMPSRTPNIAFYLANAAEGLPADIRSMCYDLITCCSAFVLLPAETFEDRVSLVRRYRECLKPGGLFIFDVPVPGTQFITEILARAFNDVCGKKTMQRDWIESEQTMKKLMVEAGFKEENVEIITTNSSYKHYEVPIDKIEEAWEGILKIKFYEPILKDVSPADLATLKQIFMKEMLAHEKDGLIKDDNHFYIIIGKLD